MGKCFTIGNEKEKQEQVLRVYASFMSHLIRELPLSKKITEKEGGGDIVRHNLVLQNLGGFCL